MIKMENIEWDLKQKPSDYLYQMLKQIKIDENETLNNQYGLAVTIGKVVALESLSDIYK